MSTDNEVIRRHVSTGEAEDTAGRPLAVPRPQTGEAAPYVDYTEIHVYHDQFIYDQYAMYLPSFGSCDRIYLHYLLNYELPQSN